MAKVYNLNDQTALGNQAFSSSSAILFRQPDIDPEEDFSRKLFGFEEDVDFVSGCGLRFWYNTQNAGYPLHRHSCYEIIICLEDEYHAVVDSQHYDMKSGDILIIPPQIMHELKPQASGARFILLCDVGSIMNQSDILATLPDLKTACFYSDNCDAAFYQKLRDSLMKMIEYYFRREPFWELQVYGSLFSILAMIGQAHASARVHAGQDSGQTQDLVTVRRDYPRFVNLLSFLDEHFSDEITLEAAAQYMGYSKYYFAHVFKDLFHNSFYDYLILRRVESAKRMLGTNLSIREIAERCGFHSISSFSRTFRKVTGMSPSQYRSALHTT